MREVLVVGAGLAGLAAALELARGGARVTVAERRGYPGGRASSFPDPSGEIVDNGQHVFLGCCEAYRAFVEAAGAGSLVRLQERTRILFLDERDGSRSWLKESRWLPSPFHFVPSLLRFRPLPFRDRLAVLRAGRAMKDETGSDAQSFGDWLRSRDQTPEAIRHFWDPSAISLLNERVDEVSAAQGLFVFRTAFFSGREAARIGLATGALGDVAARAVDRIRELGGRVEFHRKVERLPEGPVICAVPPRALRDLLPPDLRDHPTFGPLERIRMAPIVNLHFFFERPVEGPDFFACLGGRLQWVFLHGRRVTLSQSGARDLLDVPNAALETEFLEALARVWPPVRQAGFRRSLIVREREATFVPSPGARARRLPARTPRPDLYLAGEWTEGEWPSTMEGAVRSGQRAARYYLSEAGN